MKNRKYSKELKAKVVDEYLLGYSSLKGLAKKYGISSTGLISVWVSTFKQNPGGEFSDSKNSTYTLELKVKALEMYFSKEKTMCEIAAELKIKNISQISAWGKRFREEGISGLTKTQGRQKTMSNKSGKESNDELKKRIKELEYENRLLRIKSEYLELLRSLRQKETSSKQESSTNSENDTN